MLKYYKAYFKGLAISNIAIGHTEQKPAYFFVRDKYNPDAFDKALKPGIKVPAMLLEPYTWKGKNGLNRNYFQYLGGRFNLVTKVSVDKEETIELAQEDCEALAEEILAKMREHFEEGGYITAAPGDVSKKIFFEYDEVTIDQIGPINTNFYGVTVGFILKTPAKANSTAGAWSL